MKENPQFLWMCLQQTALSSKMTHFLQLAKLLMNLSIHLLNILLSFISFWQSDRRRNFCLNAVSRIHNKKMLLEWIYVFKKLKWDLGKHYLYCDSENDSAIWTGF